MVRTMLQPPASSAEGTVCIELPLSQVGSGVIWRGPRSPMPTALLHYLPSSHRPSCSGMNLRARLFLDSLPTPLLPPGKAKVLLWQLSQCSWPERYRENRENSMTATVDTTGAAR